MNDPQNAPDEWVQRPRVGSVESSGDLIMTDTEGVDIVLVFNQDGEQFVMDLSEYKCGWDR